MRGTRDWLEWHTPYADEQSPLSRRLRLVQGHIAALLEQRPGETLHVVSVCAGQGHDLIGVLAERADAHRVHATLLEYDQRNVDIARALVQAAGLTAIQVVHRDAGERTFYLGCVPADLVLVAGVFGNISDADVHRVRADGDETSYIDLLLVHPPVPGEKKPAQMSANLRSLLSDALGDFAKSSAENDDAAQQWESQVDRLRERVEGWTGNSLQIIDLSFQEWRHPVAQHRPLLVAIERDGVALVKARGLSLSQPGDAAHR